MMKIEKNTKKEVSKKAKVEPPPKALEILLELFKKYVVKNLPRPTAIDSEIYGSGLTEKLLGNKPRSAIRNSPASYPTYQNEFIRIIKQRTDYYPTLLEDVTKTFSDLVNREADESDNRQFFRDYLLYFSLWDWLRELAHINSESKSIPEIADELNKYFSQEKLNRSLSVNSRTKVKLGTDLFDLAIDGAELYRLRVCPICSNIFWAYKINRWGCSPICNNNLRTRRNRLKAQKAREKINIVSIADTTSV